MWRVPRIVGLGFTLTTYHTSAHMIEQSRIAGVDDSSNKRLGISVGESLVCHAEMPSSIISPVSPIFSLPKRISSQSVVLRLVRVTALDAISREETIKA